MDVENIAERNERLGAGAGRQTQIASVLGLFESPASDRSFDGELEALCMLVVDAVMDHDDYALRFVVDGVHRLLFLWDDVEGEGSGETRGELRGLHNVSSMALERMVPLAVLAEVAPDTLPHDVLTYIGENPGCSNDDLILHTGKDKTQVSRAGRRLHDVGLARKQRVGSRNAWQVTPRGVAALHAATAGWARPADRKRMKV